MQATSETRLIVRSKTCPSFEKSLPSDLSLSNDSLDVEESSCNMPETPQAASSSWYEFFVPNVVQRRLKRFEMIKLTLRLMAARAREDRETLKSLLAQVMSELEVFRIPILNEERHGPSEINAFRDYIYDSLADINTQLVDITQADSKGSTFSVRLIFQGKQIRPAFPQFPVNKSVKCGLEVSYTIDGAWQPKEVSWNFIPLQPLLDIVSMQGLMGASEGSTSPPSPASSSPDSNEDLEGDLAKKELDHQNGVCIPCSFYVFRIDGCRHGDACKYCHLCTPKQAKSRRRHLRKEVNKQKAKDCE